MFDWDACQQAIGRYSSRFKDSFLDDPIMNPVFACGVWVDADNGVVEAQEIREVEQRMVDHWFGDVERFHDGLKNRHSRGTTLHHLSHLAQFWESTGLSPGELKSVVEWGGGYGNMARLFKLFNPEVDYHIIDLPGVLKLQEQYFKRTRTVGIHQHTSLDDIQFSPSLFISTWALSESRVEDVENVFASEFCGADKVFVAWHNRPDFPASQLFDRLAREKAKAVYPAIGESFYGVW